MRPRGMPAHAHLAAAFTHPREDLVGTSRVLAAHACLQQCVEGHPGRLQPPCHQLIVPKSGTQWLDLPFCFAVFVKSQEKTTHLSSSRDARIIDLHEIVVILALLKVVKA